MRTDLSTGDKSELPGTRGIAVASATRPQLKMSIKVQAAKILEQRSYIVPGKLKVTEHFFEVPLDHSNSSSGKLRLFARSAQRHETPADPEDVGDSTEAKKKQQLPWLVYLQGGPGYGCPPPQESPWTNYFVDKGYRMLYLDQRGTGLSSPIAASTLGLIGDTKVQVDYMKAFRADNIVRDCEAVRQALTADYPEEKKKWSVIGQSYGGFCIMTYLSFYSQGLRECFITGGTAPLTTDPDQVYQRCFQTVIKRNKVYYEKFPEDVERVKTIIRYLGRHGDNTVRLPSEGILHPRRFLQLGLNFGMHGGIDNVHDIVLEAHTQLQSVGHITRKTLEAMSSPKFDEAPIYTLLHEPLYCQGKPSNWSAQRALDALPEFNLARTLEDSSQPVYFTGEMIFPFMLDCYAELRKMKDVAEQLAQFKDWPALYDEAQLAKNEVPVYAAIFTEDMYVHFDLTMETVKKVKGIKPYIVNVLYHNAIRAHMEEVVDPLWKLRSDTID